MHQKLKTASAILFFILPAANLAAEETLVKNETIAKLEKPEKTVKAERTEKPEKSEHTAFSGPFTFAGQAIPAAEAISPEPGTKLYNENEARQTENQFAVYIPASYKAATPLPLLMSAEGPKLIGEWQKFADETGFIVVNPTFISRKGGELNVFDAQLKADEKMLSNILKRVFGSLSIDRKHVLFTGCSAGAFPAWFIAGRHPEVFTALCFRSGNFVGEIEGLTEYMPEWKQRPVYMYWGEKDRPRVSAQNAEAVEYLEKKIKLENFKHEIIPEGGHTSRPDLASKWFESVIRETNK